MQRRVFRIDGEPSVATRDGSGLFETYGTLFALVEGQAPSRERASEEAAREAAAADAVAAAEIATERGAARGGAQVVRSGTAARPGAPSRGRGKRGV